MPPEETEIIETGEGPTVVLKSEGEGPLNIFEATAALRKARENAYGPPEGANDAPEGANDAQDAASSPRPTIETTPPQAEDAAPPETAAPSEPTEETPAEPIEDQLPPVEPPRSWTREDKDWFASLPRDTAERIAERERLREQDFSRRQQEAADKQRALEAKSAEADRARAQFEGATRDAVASLQAQITGEFADIKTWDDVEKMAKEDPFRAIRYNLTQQKLQQAQAVLAQTEARTRTDIANRWQDFSKTEDQKFAERVPEMSDPSRVKTLRTNVENMLKDVGFKEEEWRAAWKGETGISLRDHRAQLILRDAALWREAQAKAKAIPAKRAQVPPVQKPGTVRPRGIDTENEIAALEKQLETLSGDRANRAATRLISLKRAAGQL